MPKARGRPAAQKLRRGRSSGPPSPIPILEKKKGIVPKPTTVNERRATVTVAEDQAGSSSRVTDRRVIARATRNIDHSRLLVLRLHRLEDTPEFRGYSLTLAKTSAPATQPKPQKPNKRKSTTPHKHDTKTRKPYEEAPIEPNNSQISVYQPRLIPDSRATACPKPEFEIQRELAYLERSLGKVSSLHREYKRCTEALYLESKQEHEKQKLLMERIKVYIRSCPNFSRNIPRNLRAIEDSNEAASVPSEKNGGNGTSGAGTTDQVELITSGMAQMLTFRIDEHEDEVEPEATESSDSEEEEISKPESPKILDSESSVIAEPETSVQPEAMEFSNTENEEISDSESEAAEIPETESVIIDELGSAEIDEIEGQEIPDVAEFNGFQLVDVDPIPTPNISVAPDFTVSGSPESDAEELPEFEAVNMAEPGSEQIGEIPGQKEGTMSLAQTDDRTEETGTGPETFNSMNTIVRTRANTPAVINRRISGIIQEFKTMGNTQEFRQALPSPPHATGQGTAHTLNDWLTDAEMKPLRTINQNLVQAAESVRFLKLKTQEIDMTGSLVNVHHKVVQKMLQEAKCIALSNNYIQGDQRQSLLTIKIEVPSDEEESNNSDREI